MTNHPLTIIPPHKQQGQGASSEQREKIGETRRQGREGKSMCEELKPRGVK